MRVSIPPSVGTGKSWRRLVSGVDRSKPGGYAFVGRWIQPSRTHELNPGSIIVCYDEDVPVGVNIPSVEVMYLTTGGTWETLAMNSSRSWAAEIMDVVESHTGSAIAPPLPVKGGSAWERVREGSNNTALQAVTNDVVDSGATELGPIISNLELAYSALLADGAGAEKYCKDCGCFVIGADYCLDCATRRVGEVLGRLSMLRRDLATAGI